MSKPHLCKSFIISLLLFTGMAHGQTQDPYKGFRNPAFQVGINNSQIDNDDVGGYHQPGFTVGLSAQIGFSKASALQIEAIYSRKGSRVTQEQLLSIRGQKYYQFRLDYASFPILYHFNYEEKATLFLGPSINALIGARKEVGNSGFIENVDEFQPIDVCGEIGLGFYFLDRMALTGRFIYSLAPMNRIQLPEDARTGAAGAYNHSLSFRLIYLLAKPPE